MKKLLSLLLIMIVLLAGCAATTDGAEETVTSSAVAVETATAQRGSMSSLRSLQGKVEADADVSVMAPLPVKVTAVYVKEGDIVTAGDVLFSLDKTDIEKQYGPLKNNYDRTQTVAAETLRQMRQNLEDTKALYEAGFASQKEVEGLELTLLAQETQFAATLDTLSVNMDSVTDMLADASVKAPISGIVTSISVVVSANASPAAPAAVISRTEKVTASFEVSEAVLTGLYIGQPVTVTSTTAGGVYEAEITSVSQAASAYTKLYSVKAEIDNTAGELCSGMFITASLESERRDDTVTIPSRGVVATAQGSVVFVAKDGIARSVPVETGLVSGDTTQITAGLKGGEQVIVKGQSYIEDGDEIRIVGNQGE